ncbi:MAG TPA: hypothetical protein VFI03_02150 [Solirubrobacterales bacterium]|nr:hypothetical protein [Solirubrobacterales bacterium]
MSWTLEIHQIDVGQGESSLLVAREPVGNLTKSMLIDGGETGYAETVHKYIKRTGVRQLDHMLVSHYDDDHSGGILALLLADNAYAVSAAIADTVTVQPANGTERQVIAGFAAAACSAILGAYGPDRGSAAEAVDEARARVPPNATPEVAAAFGAREAERHAPNPAQPTLLYPTVTRRKIARTVGVEAAKVAPTNDPQDVWDIAQEAAFGSIVSGLPPGSQFSTGGCYANANVIDIGPNPKIPGGYLNAIAGAYTHQANPAIWAPGTNRVHTVAPALGSELLFNSGQAPAPPQPTAPAAVVAAINRRTWPNNALFPPSGQPDNDVSIGLVVQFNNFVYWTAGDLPSNGEEPVGAALMAQRLPRPGGGTFPQATRIACIKCGHHGADSASSQAFLQTVRPVGAILSSGNNEGLQHPTQEVVDRLHSCPTIRFFYLTNCNFGTTNVPATEARNQLRARSNKSRVAGDNTLPNLKVGRRRGDIQLTVQEGESLRQAGDQLRTYTVTYLDEDAPPLYTRPEQSVF